jgi:hypothetical protein
VYQGLIPDARRSGFAAQRCQHAAIDAQRNRLARD